MRRSTLHFALVALSTAALAACGSASSDDTGNTGTTATDGGGSDAGAADGGTTDGGASTTGVTLNGQVLLSDGSPANVQVRFCASLCRSIFTDDAGNFEYLNVDPGHYALEAIDLSDQKNMASPLDLMSIADGEQRVLDTPIIVYPYQTVSDLGAKAQQVKLDGGLTVMADPSVMVASDANSPALADGESDYVSSVRVDPGAIGLPLDEVQGTVVAAWFMGRFSVALTTPWSFTLADDLGLAEGAQVHVLASSYDEKSWLDGGTATVAGGQIVSDDGSGIPVLSTVLLVTE
ncbi:MAG: hypothetical protein GXP62_08780 [Oligoflexia bacterium]|nr:hypothetical protein [Oligoflexia bacterium]